MNIERGYTPIEINGQELYLRLDFNALATADQNLSGSALQALGTGSIYAIQQILLAGLRNPMNDRKAARAVRDLNPGQIEYYLDCIMDALEVSGFLAADAEGEPEAPRKRGKAELTTIE